MAELHSREQLLAAYQGKKTYPEDGAECFLEVLVDIRDQLVIIAEACKQLSKPIYEEIKPKIEPKHQEENP